jgi:hypothetical protein
MSAGSVLTVKPDNEGTEHCAAASIIEGFSKRALCL